MKWNPFMRPKEKKLKFFSSNRNWRFFFSWNESYQNNEKPLHFRDHFFKLFILVKWKLSRSKPLHFHDFFSTTVFFFFHFYDFLFFSWNESYQNKSFFFLLFIYFFSRFFFSSNQSCHFHDFLFKTKPQHFYDFLTIFSSWKVKILHFHDFFTTVLSLNKNCLKQKYFKTLAFSRLFRNCFSREMKLGKRKTYKNPVVFSRSFFNIDFSWNKNARK